MAPEKGSIDGIKAETCEVVHQPLLEGVDSQALGPELVPLHGALEKMTANVRNKRKELPLREFITYLGRTAAQLAAMEAKMDTAEKTELVREYVAMLWAYHADIKKCSDGSLSVLRGREIFPTTLERHPDGYMMQLELGKWTKQGIDKLLAEASEIKDMNERTSYIAMQLQNTPFTYESQLPIPERGVIRVRLETLDCITFVHTIVAMSQASNFNEFVTALRDLRYRNPETEGLNNDPDKGNIEDFAENIYLENAVHRGIVENVTASIAAPSDLVRHTTVLRATQRAGDHDVNRTVVRPKIKENERVSAMFIKPEAIGKYASKIRTGDILLFTRGSEQNVLIGHGAMAVNSGGKLYLMHATAHYFNRPNATASTPPSATGVYYEGNPKHEQIGVNIQGAFDDRGPMVKVDGAERWGYNPNSPRTLSDYASLFKGVLVLRPSTPKQDVPLAYRGAR